MTPATLLELKNLTVSFGTGKEAKTALRSVSFSLREGECLGLAGESGSGKSTIANAIMRFLPIAQGEILFRGKNIAALPDKERRQLYRDVQMVFQNPDEAISPRMKLERYITEAAESFGLSHPVERGEKARELLRAVGLREEYADRLPAFLSGGERQRAAIARAVSILPSLLICDEPTSALDVSVQAHIVELLLRLQKEYQMTYLFISHDLPLISHICHRVVILYRGEIMEILPHSALAGKARHPYTKKLLSASFDASYQEPPIVTAGESASLAADACPFLAECPYRKERCRQEKPPLSAVAPDHAAACWL